MVVFGAGHLSRKALAAGSRSQALPGNVLFARLRLATSGGAGNTVRYQGEPGNERKVAQKPLNHRGKPGGD